MIYLIAGMAITIALLGAAVDVEHNRVIAAKAQVEALGSKVEQQNQAILATKADGDRRVKEAQDGLARATQGAASARAEAARLRTLAQSGKTPLGACPAGMAVAELRRGLR